MIDKEEIIKRYKGIISSILAAAPGGKCSGRELRHDIAEFAGESIDSIVRGIGLNLESFLSLIPDVCRWNRWNGDLLIEKNWNEEGGHMKTMTKSQSVVNQRKKAARSQSVSAASRWGSSCSQQSSASSNMSIMRPFRPTRTNFMHKPNITKQPMKYPGSMTNLNRNNGSTHQTTSSISERLNRGDMKITTSGPPVKVSRSVAYVSNPPVRPTMPKMSKEDEMKVVDQYKNSIKVILQDLGGECTILKLDNVFYKKYKTSLDHISNLCNKPVVEFLGQMNDICSLKRDGSEVTITLNPSLKAQVEIKLNEVPNVIPPCESNFEVVAKVEGGSCNVMDYVPRKKRDENFKALILAKLERIASETKIEPSVQSVVHETNQFKICDLKDSLQHHVTKVDSPPSKLISTNPFKAMFETEMIPPCPNSNNPFLNEFTQFRVSAENQKSEENVTEFLQPIKSEGAKERNPNAIRRAPRLQTSRIFQSALSDVRSNLEGSEMSRSSSRISLLSSSRVNLADFLGVDINKKLQEDLAKTNMAVSSILSNDKNDYETTDMKIKIRSNLQLELLACADVDVCNVSSPFQFWIKFKDLNFSQTMNEHYKENIKEIPKLKSYKIGDTVAVCRKKCWYRGEVLCKTTSESNFTTYLVSLVDMAISEHYKIDELRPLHKKFVIPGRCSIKASLHGVKPSNNENYYSLDAILFFRKIVEKGPIFAQFKRGPDESSIIHEFECFTEKTDAQHVNRIHRINIADELVSRNFAEKI